jgi:DNA polymerase-3 subunit delta
MKLAYKEVDGYLENPQKYQSCLFFGPDNGLVRERAKHVMSKLVYDANDPFATTSLDNDKIIENPSLVYEAASSLSLLGGAPVVFIRDASDKLTSILQEVHKTTECKNSIVCIAGELNTNSSLRLFFERSKQTVAIGCYKDDNQSLPKYIAEKLKANGISYDYNLLTFLSSKLGNDRAVSASEIEKLITYLGEKKELKLSDLEKIINLNDDKNLESLCVAVADGKFNQSNQFIERLLQEGTEPIVIFRSLQRYFQRLLIVHGHIQQGLSSDIAMKKLSPPVFFKLEKTFKQHLSTISFSQLLVIQARIFEAERDIKTGKDALAVCLRTVSGIALLVKQR